MGGTIERDSPKRPIEFFLEVYPDATNYDCDMVLASLDDVFIQWAYILHDRDLKDDGTGFKKPHIHIYGRRKSQSTIEATAKKLGIPSNYVERCKSRKGSIRYLIHIDDPEKAQYDKGDVVSNFDVLPLLDYATEVKRIQALVDQIYAGNTTTIGLVRFALENGCWSEFRRSYSIMKDLIVERTKIYG